ncbi:MAG: hypothetical protein ACRC0L_11055, partial [Angustibacter sp.]
MMAAGGTSLTAASSAQQSMGLPSAADLAAAHRALATAGPKPADIARVATEQAHALLGQSCAVAMRQDSDEFRILATQGRLAAGLAGEVFGNLDQLASALSAVDARLHRAELAETPGELLLIADEATALTEGQAKILDILATLTGLALGLSMRGAELNVEQDRR